MYSIFSSCWFVFFNVSLHQQLKKNMFIYICVNVPGSFVWFYFSPLFVFNYYCILSLFRLVHSCASLTVQTKKKQFFLNCSEKERNRDEMKGKKKKMLRTILFTWRKPFVLTHISLYSLI
jgi:hypothetical protein